MPGPAAPMGILPAEMRAVVAEWLAHPSGQFVQRIYRKFRRPAP